MNWRRAAVLIGLALVTTSGAVAGAEPVACGEVIHRDTPFTVCEVDPAKAEIRLWHRDAAGEVYGSFAAIEAETGPLAMAMNGGMYHPDREPVGHYVEDGVETMRVIASAGPGNFGMLPNGVFCISDGAARVWETADYLARDPDCAFATQSGPMLVIDGALHQRFLPGSDSRHVRNGVGTSDDGSKVVFAISDRAVNFHDFATLFRDRLGLRQALYFDGKVSRLHAPGIGRSDAGFAMGPIVGVLAGGE